MKFVILLAVLALLSADRVSGFEWLKKRESEPVPARECLTPSCRNVFEPVMDVLDTPASELLIEDGRLSLDCSRQTLNEADECTNPSSFLCDSPYQITLKVNAALNIFCRNKADIEKEPSCWTNSNLLRTTMACYNDDRQKMEAVQRDILRKNHSDLVTSIQHVEEVVDKLVQFGVLTCLMKAEIIDKPQTSFDRVRELLSMLPRRGPQAYSLFCKALEECGGIQAMTLLGLETKKTELQDPRCHLHLGDDVYVTAKTWDDVLNIHVRKYEVYPSDMTYPTKRGIVLSLKHLVELPGAIRFIEEAVKEGKLSSQWHLGANVFVVMDSTGIEIRQCCWDNSMKSMVPRANHDN